MQHVGDLQGLLSGVDSHCMNRRCNVSTLNPNPKTYSHFNSQNVVELLDDLFQRAAEAPGESPEMNFIKKHAGSMKV